MKRAVYVSTCLERRPDAQRLAGLLRAAGYEVTSRWIDDPGATRDAERVLTTADAYAIHDLNTHGILMADVFVCIADKRGRGTLHEIGYADALGRSQRLDRVLVGNWRDLGPMCSVWDLTCEDLDGVVPALAGMT